VGKKRPERSARREQERAARRLVLDRERLFLLERGGSKERPIEVASSAVIEVRARALPCPQCAGSLAVLEHQADSATSRQVLLRCVTCGVKRTLHFQLVAAS